MAGWTCPFCTQTVTLIDANISINDHKFAHNNKHGNLIIRTTVIVCPNDDCRQFTLRASLFEAEWGNASHQWRTKEQIDYWQLIPPSSAKPFPEYIPKPVLDDYKEACLIRDLSPKASATLARRCLQGMIRDYWGESKARLVDEIDAIRTKVDPLTWSAIDAVRRVGNIGAHMEKDINLIIEVEPEEAGMLLGLIELLIKDWYILRHEREAQLRAVVKLSEDKKAAKSGP